MMLGGIGLWDEPRDRAIGPKQIYQFGVLVNAVNEVCWFNWFPHMFPNVNRNFQGKCVRFFPPAR